MFKVTTAIKKIRSLKARKKVIQGGTYAGKTYGIEPVLIDRAAKESGLKITIVAETIPAVRDGAVDIFKEIMDETGRWQDVGWKGNPMEYTFQNKSRIQFKSFDTVGKAKAAGKRDILFLNEANHIPFEIADALMIRSKETYIDYNPDNEFWAHTETLTEPNSEFLLLTYEDNEALPPEIYEDLMIKKDKAFKDVTLSKDLLFDDENIKSSYWANWCKVYLYGQTGKLEGVIFDNWEYGEFPKDQIGVYGLDLGYKNDPDACVQVFIDEAEKKIYLKEHFYRVGQSIEALAAKIQTLPMGKIIADNSDQRVTDYLVKLCQRSIVPVKKPPNSIIQGIRIMQNYELIIDPTSHALVKELRHYKWTDKDKPIDDWNHLIDAARYVIYTYANRTQPIQQQDDSIHSRFNKGGATGFYAAPWASSSKEPSSHFM